MELEMNVDEDNLNLSRNLVIGMKCNNCSSEIQNDLQSVKITTLKNNIIHDDTEVHIWDALAFIYGITWTSIENYKSGKATEFLETQQDLRFCNKCTSLLKDNYNSHSKFEHSCESSSIVKLLKELRDYKINSPENKNDFQCLSNDRVKTVESDIKMDLLEDFASENPEEDPFQSEDPVEVKYEPQSQYNDDFSDGNTSENIKSVGSPPLRYLRSNKHLVIKTEKLSPEEILQFTNKITAKKKRGRPIKLRKSKAVTKLGIDCNAKNKGKLKEKSSPAENIPKEGQNLLKPNKKGIDRRVKQKSPEKRKPKEAQNLPKPRKKEYKKTVKPTGSLGSKQNMTFDEKVKLVMEKYKDNFACPKITVNGRYVCTVCGKTFKDYGILRHKHWKPKHFLNPADRVCICDICGKSLTTKKYMKWHKLRVHGTEEEQNKWQTKCNLCDTIVFSFDMAYHTTMKHSDVQEKCDQCDKVFGNKLTLKAHIEVHNDKLEKCSFCEKMMKEKHLKTHIKNVHSNREKPFCCDLCPLRFFTKGIMERHRLTHSDLRQYVCDECGKTFKYASHLRDHLQCHKEIATKGGWAFTCDLCEGSTFKHSLGLERHMYRIHGKGKTKIYECSICSKQLSSSSILKTHENMHKEIPGFVPRVRTKLPDYIKKCKISKKNNTTVESLPQPVSASEEVDSNL